jgi:PadR family transcriptional regulator
MPVANQSALDVRQLYSGLIRLHILHHSAKGGIFGLGLIEELARHGYKLSPGTLYPILHGLEQDGLLSSQKHNLEGKIRRVYRATAAGESALKCAKDKVKELFNELFEAVPVREVPRKGPTVVTVQPPRRNSTRRAANNTF